MVFHQYVSHYDSLVESLSTWPQSEFIIFMACRFRELSNLLYLHSDGHPDLTLVSWVGLLKRRTSHILINLEGKTKMNSYKVIR